MSSTKPLRTLGVRLWALLAFVMVVAAIAAYFFAGVLNQARIGSERYQQIMASEDLVADVTSPDLQLVQAQMSLQGLALAEATAPVLELPGLSELETSYQARYVALLAETTNPEIRAALTTTNAAAQDYFTEVEGDFTAAAEAGDRKQMRALLGGPIAEKYAAHEESLAEVARLAEAQSLAAEQSARRALREDKFQLMIIGAGLGLLGIALTALTLRSISTRLRGMRQLASKDFPKLIAEAEVDAESSATQAAYVAPAIRGKDEMARTERALQRVVGTAVELAGDQARLRHSTAEMFTYHGRRNYQLLSDGLRNLETLETATHVDQSAEFAQLRNSLKRMRLNAEGMLVVAGAAPIRAGSAEATVEQAIAWARSQADPATSSRVQVDLQSPPGLRDEVDVDLANLAAELLDNALKFTAGEVSIVGRPEGDGYELLVCDNGLGIESTQLAHLNDLLANGEVDLRDSRRMGLSVAARLAFRNDFDVALSHLPSGGLEARVWLPASCLTTSGKDVESLRTPTLSLAKSPAPVVEVAEASDDVELPRRIRGASLEESLRELPATVIVPEHRDPEVVRSSLAALAIGQQAASEYQDDNVDDQE